MDPESGQKWLAEERRRCLERCRGKAFVRKVFASGPSLRTLKPELGDDEHPFYLSEAYTGQDYDAEMFRIVEDGWDHEHCNACWFRINPGDECWQCADGSPVYLCFGCYEQLTAGPAEPKKE